jgi:hypothetical protein
LARKLSESHCSVVSRVAALGRCADYRDGGFFVPECPSAPIITQRVDYVLVRNSLQSLGLVLEETDETLFWLEMLGHCNIVAGTALRTLIRAANELTCIFVASLTRAKKVRELTEP